MIIGIVASGVLSEEEPAWDPVLDDHTSGMWGAYSLTRLLSSYDGPSIRVRRSSDSAESDIGFWGPGLDTAALAAFVGAGDGFVVRWYDQSGGGNDLVQTTTARQPRVVVGGVFQDCVWFEGGGIQGLQSETSMGAGTAKTFYQRGILANDGFTQVLIEVGDGTGSTINPVIYRNSSNAWVLNQYVSGATQSEAQYSTTLSDDVVHAYAFNRTGGSAAACHALYVDGVSASETVTINNNPTGSYGAAPLNYGSRNNAGSYQSRLRARALVAYDVDKTADVVEISAALGLIPAYEGP